MTVDPADKNILKIHLTDEEVNCIFGGYERINYSNPRTRAALGLLLKEATEIEHFTLDSESLLIEVKPAPNGCVIIFSKPCSSVPKRLRRADTKRTYILEFFDTDDMTAGILELYLKAPNLTQSQLYRFENTYRLVLHSSKNLNDLMIHMGEYCSKITFGSNEAALCAEYGTPLCLNNAIEKIGRAFKT